MAATPTPTPAPQPDRQFVAIEHFGGDGRLVEILTAGGSVVARTKLDERQPESGPVGWGNRGVFLYDVGKRELTRLDVDGTTETLGLLGVRPEGVAESPDGHAWVYSEVSWSNETQSTASTSELGPIATSRIYVGTAGAAPRLPATLSRPNATGAGLWAGGYRVLRWDPAGVLLGSAPTNVGGGGPFIGESYGLATVVRLDPATGLVSQPLTSDCRFSDAAPDGAIACVAAGRIEVRRPSGATMTIDTHSQKVGQVAFAGGSSTVTYWTVTDRQQVGTGRGWVDHVFVAQLDSATPSTKELSPPEGWFLDEGWAFDHVLGSMAVAVAISPATFDGSSTVALVDLGTGLTTTVLADAAEDVVVGAS